LEAPGASQGQPQEEEKKVMKREAGQKKQVLKNGSALQRKILPLVAVPGLSALAGCGLINQATQDQLQAALSDAALYIQGSKPAGSILPVGRVAQMDMMRSLTGRSGMRSSLLEGDTAVALPVLGDDGAEIGTITLSDARVVLREIHIKTVGGLSSDSAESTGRVAMSGSSDDSTDDSADDSSGDSSSEDSADSSEEDSGDATVGSDGETDAEFTGPFVVNLLSDAVYPDLSSLSIPVGIYKEVSMKIAKLEDADVAPMITAGGLVDESDSLVSNSISLTGTFDPGTPSDVSDDVVFSFSGPVEEEFELHAGELANGGIDLSSGAINSIVIAFRMGKWFDFTGTGIDFASLAGSAIDLTEGEVYSAVKDAIKASADWGKDEDGDGRLGSSEDSDEEDSHDSELEQEDSGD